jgi:hypothetical protein
VWWYMPDIPATRVEEGGRGSRAARAKVNEMPCLRSKPKAKDLGVWLKW